MNYYNEFDPNAAAWLRELIARKLIPAGEVDERSITDVSPNDLLGFTQCHFFAGIGGWSLALQLARWPEDRPVWTGSCPCQPFSSAGKQMGRKDPRHLWPAFRRLINRCRPPVVFGEQVASADGRKWLAGVCSNLETMGYAPAALDLCAAGVTAPHIRQRLYWVADAHCEKLYGRIGDGNSPRCGGSSNGLGMGHANHAGSQGYDRHGDHWHQPGRIDAQPAGSVGEAGGSTSGMADAAGGRREMEGFDDGIGRKADGVGQANIDRGDRSPNFWNDSVAILCRDGKHRRIPTEPALFPLAHGLSYKLARRGSIRPALLKGSGNAIVPEVAAEFICAYLETERGAA